MERHLWRLGFFRYAASTAVPRLMARAGNSRQELPAILSERKTRFVTLADGDIDDGAMS